MASFVPANQLAQPFRFALALIAMIVVVEAAFGVVFNWIAPNTPITTVGLVTGAVLSALVGVVLWRMGWWQASGLTRAGSLREWLLLLPFVAYGLLPLTAGVRATPGALLVGTLAGVLIGFWKLGVLLMLLLSFSAQGAWRAALLAALLFGVMHLGGLLVGGAFVPTLLLSLSYLFLGWAYGAAWLRTQLLWPLVLANALLIASAAATQGASSPNLAPSVAQIMPAVIISIIFALYGTFLLRNVKR